MKIVNVQVNLFKSGKRLITTIYKQNTECKQCHETMKVINKRYSVL